MKKPIIQIPSCKEDKALAITLRALPRAVPGFDAVAWLIIHHCGEDRTAACPEASGRG